MGLIEWNGVRTPSAKGLVLADRDAAFRALQTGKSKSRFGQNLRLTDRTMTAVFGRFALCISGVV